MHDEHDTVVWKENTERQTWWESVLGLDSEPLAVVRPPHRKNNGTAAA